MASKINCYQCFRNDCGCAWKEERSIQKMSKKIYKRYIKDYRFSSDFAFEAIVPITERAKGVAQNWLYEVENQWCNKNRELVRMLIVKKLREITLLSFTSWLMWIVGVNVIIFGIFTKNTSLKLSVALWVGGTVLAFTSLYLGSLSKSIYRYDPKVYNLYYFNDHYQKETFQDTNFLAGNISFYNKERFRANLLGIGLKQEEMDVAMGLYLDGFKGNVEEVVLIAKML